MLPGSCWFILSFYQRWMTAAKWSNQILISKGWNTGWCWWVKTLNEARRESCDPLMVYRIVTKPRGVRWGSSIRERVVYWCSKQHTNAKHVTTRPEDEKWEHQFEATQLKREIHRSGKHMTAVSLRFVSYTFYILAVFYEGYNYTSTNISKQQKQQI